MDGHRAAEWLNFLGELLVDQLCSLPIDRIAGQLARTLDSPVCALIDLDGSGSRCWAWQFTDVGRPGQRRILPHWEELFSQLSARYRVEVPLRPAPLQRRAFVLGRQRPYSTADVEFARSVQLLLDGLDRQLASPSVATATDGPSADRAGLTPRETTALTLMASGLTAAAAARRMAIAERTVNKHLEHAYRKLDVSDRTSAVLRAKRLGLLD